MKILSSAKLFKACTPTEEVRFKFYLMSGFRDAEGRFVTWRDVDFKHMAVRVTAKPHWGFQSEELGGKGGPRSAEADRNASEVPSCKRNPRRSSFPQCHWPARRRHVGKT